MKNILVITVLLFSIKVYSQISLTGYTANAISISSNSTKQLFGELRIFNIDKLDNFHAEISAIFNVLRKDNYLFGIGLGYGFDKSFYDYNYYLPLQLQFYPVKDQTSFIIVIEGSPSMTYSGNSFDFGFRPLLGLRYNF
jgi:hypothetical protein